MASYDGWFDCRTIQGTYLGAPDIAVRCRIERLAAPVGREHAGALRAGGGRICQHKVDARSQRGAAGARQMLRGQVSGHQRGRARRVHAHLRSALQAVHERRIACLPESKLPDMLPHQ